jgi:hypothetical protein
VLVAVLVGCTEIDEGVDGVGAKVLTAGEQHRGSECGGRTVDRSDEIGCPCG